MEKISLIQRLKLLSKSQGNSQWKVATRTILVVIIAVILGEFFGLDKGLPIIVFITLLASMVIDTPLPLNTVVKLEIICAVMMSLAFISVGLISNSTILFLIFTSLWSFFTISLYIFGNTYGALGFLLFDAYFVAIVTVNPTNSPLDLGFYIIFSYMVASILLIPKIFFNEDKTRKTVAMGFYKETKFIDMVKTRQILSGTKINSQLYQLFNLGISNTALRRYSYHALYHLSPEIQKSFTSFLESIEKVSERIGDQITGKWINDEEYKGNKKKNGNIKNITPQEELFRENEMDLKNIKDDLLKIDSSYPEFDVNLKTNWKVLFDISNSMIKILEKSQSILHDNKNKEKTKFLSPKTSLKETLQSNFNLKNMYIRHSLRFTVAMIIGLLIVYFTHSRDAIWVVMGILIIMKPDISSTTDNFILRIFFNFLGVIAAIILGVIFPHHIFIWIGLLMLFFFRAFYPNNMGPAIMALTIFIVLIYPGNLMSNATARVIDLTLGGLIAFIMAYMVLPNRITFNIPQQTTKTINTIIESIKTVFVSNEKEFHISEIMKTLKKFHLEFNNLEAALKKLQDSYKDTEEDIEFYNDLSSSLYSLLSDISLLASQMELKKSYPDLSSEGQYLICELEELVKVIENKDKYGSSKDFKQFKLKINEYTLDFNQHVNWIKFDVEYLKEEISDASERGVFQRYQNLK